VKLALEPEWEAKFEPNSYGPNKGDKWVEAKYFKVDAGRDKVFGEADGPTLVLLSRMRADPRDYVKVKGYNSPYDSSLHEYWRNRGYTKLW
jgi:hypothetical protein